MSALSHLRLHRPTHRLAAGFLAVLGLAYFGLSFAAGGSATPAAAVGGAEAMATPAIYLTGLEQVFGTQCLQIREDIDRKAKDAETAGKTYEAYALRSSRDMMCQCVPDRARQARTALRPAERDTPVTESEFTQRYALPKVIQPCIADTVRKTYGQDCARVATSMKIETASYCPCMRTVIAGLSEAEITQVGLESADYIPRAAQAQKEGRAVPEPPPTFRKFTEREAVCRK